MSSASEFASALSGYVLVFFGEAGLACLSPGVFSEKAASQASGVRVDALGLMVVRWRRRVCVVHCCLLAKRSSRTWSALLQWELRRGGGRQTSR